MLHQISGQLRERTELTQRDIVLAFLLALDELLNATTHDAPMRLTRIERLKLLPHLIRHCLGSIAEPQSFALEYGYGLPDWLVAGRNAPLSLLVENLTNPRRDIQSPHRNTEWETLFEKLDQSDLLEELDQLNESLLGRHVDPPAKAIEDLPETLAKDGSASSSTRALAARTPAQRGIAEVESLARHALRHRDERISELAWRRIRFDFPVVVAREKRCGVLLGAELCFEGQIPQATLRDAKDVIELLDPQAEIFKGKPWRPCDNVFENALRCGTDAAINLLQDIGMPMDELEQFKSPVLYLRGVLPPVIVTGESIGFPLAIEILRHALDLPPTEWVASGGIDRSGVVHRLTANDLSAKCQAVQRDGVKRGLLAAGSSSPDLPRECLLLLDEENPTLFQAATKLWGDEWHRKVHRVQSGALHTFGFSRGWGSQRYAEGATVSGVPIIVQTKQAQDIAQIFLDRDSHFAFLGGRAKSGKTWIARQLQKTLVATGDWSVDSLSMLPDGRPSTEDVVEAVRLVLTFPSPQPRRLIVLENLEWNEQLEGLEHALSDEAAAANVSILAIGRSVPGTEWVTEDCHTPRPILSDAAINDLLESVFRQFPAMEPARELSGAVKRYAHGDLWWILNLLAWAAEKGTQPAHEELIRNFLNSRIPIHTQSELDDLKKIASLSLCGAYVPADHISNTLQRGLEAIGARLVSGRGWIIRSRAACDALLSAELNDGKLAVSSEAAGRISPQHVESVLAYALEKRDSPVMVAAIRQLRRHSPATLGRVWRLMHEKLREWAGKVGSPVQLASLLDALAAHLGENDLRSLVNRLAILVETDLDRLDWNGLAICIRILRREIAFAEKDGERRVEDESGPWHSLMRELERGGLGKVLRRAAKTTEKLSLLEELWRTHDDRAHHALAKHANQFLPDHPPYAASDYVLALRLLEITANVDYLHQTDKSSQAEAYVRKACEGIANLEFSNDQNPTQDQLLLRVALRQMLGLEDQDWETLIPRIVRDLRIAAARSTLPRLSTALKKLADVNRLFAMRLLQKMNLSEQLRQSAFSAGEFATLLGTVTQLHAEAAYRLLYATSAPRQDLVMLLARRIRSSGDAKGAGRVLYAASKIDELFGTVGAGFARRLSESIGRDFLEESLRLDSRVSVLFRLIEGLTAAEVTFSDEAWQSACNVVTETIKETQRPWAPQLALLMSGSAHSGEKFAEELVERIPDDRILAGMIYAHNIEALESFHRLGRFFPEIAGQFRTSFEHKPDILDRLSRDDRPDVSLRAIQAMSDTLRRAGIHGAGAKILSSLDKRTKVTALRNSASGDVAATIHLWRRIDRDDAAKIVSWDATQDILLHKLRRSTSEPHVGVELLTSVERAKPGCGSKILGLFAAQRGPWLAFVNELCHEQNPVTQGSAFVQLSRLGAQPDEKVRETLYDWWRPKLGNILSPRALTSLLRMFATWDEQWGIAAAEMVNISRLVNRLSQGCGSDLDRSAQLIGALHILGQRGGALQLADALSKIDHVEQRVSLEAWQFLLPVLNIVSPELAGPIVPKLIGRLQRASSSCFILDDEAFWKAFGWNAYYCMHVSRRKDVLIEDRPPSFDIPKDPGTRLWATSWLAESDWVSAERDRARQELLANPPACEYEMRLPAIVALSHFSQLDASFDQIGFHWCNHSLVDPALLAVIIREGQEDGLPNRWTGQRSQDIRRELDQPYNRTNPFTEESRHLLRRHLASPA